MMAMMISVSVDISNIQAMQFESSTKPCQSISSLSRVGSSEVLVMGSLMRLLGAASIESSKL